jgi:hypothetical protein
LALLLLLLKLVQAGGECKHGCPRLGLLECLLHCGNSWAMLLLKQVAQLLCRWAQVRGDLRQWVAEVRLCPCSHT